MADFSCLLSLEVEVEGGLFSAWRDLDEADAIEEVRAPFEGA